MMAVPAYSARAQANLDRYEDVDGVMIDKFKCPISTLVMQNPETINCGHTFEGNAIRAWIGGGHNACPSCNANVAGTAFVPNVSLRRAIEEFGENTLQRMSDLERDKAGLERDKTAVENENRGLKNEKRGLQAQVTTEQLKNSGAKQRAKVAEEASRQKDIQLAERDILDLERDIQEVSSSISIKKAASCGSVVGSYAGMFPAAVAGSAMAGPVGFFAGMGVSAFLGLGFADKIDESKRESQQEKTQKEQEKLAVEAHLARLRTQQAQNRV